MQIAEEEGWDAFSSQLLWEEMAKNASLKVKKLSEIERS